MNRTPLIAWRARKSSRRHWTAPSVLFGTSSDLIRYHMEIRGLGIVSIKDLYGITAIRERKQMDLVVDRRFQGQGMRWTRKGANRLLKLRLRELEKAA